MSINPNAEHYSTAQATIGCARFPADAFVSVQYLHTKDGVDWYMVGIFKDRRDVAYPHTHLRRFAF